jgi:hypothetical protein
MLGAGGPALTTISASDGSLAGSFTVRLALKTDALMPQVSALAKSIFIALDCEAAAAPMT